jgi:ABC-type antimicrobial peptide transport system permease subunit
MTLAGIGLVFGLAGAVATTRLARGVLFGVQPLDPFTFVATSACLAVVALAAAAVPAWRATRVDPVESLKSE